MNRSAGPLFVERKKYRRRRLMDAARILPVAGFVLLMLPMLWVRGDGRGIAGEALYLFLVWAALIVMAALVARALGKGRASDTSPPPVANGPPWAGDVQQGGAPSGTGADDGNARKAAPDSGRSAP